MRPCYAQQQSLRCKIFYDSMVALLIADTVGAEFRYLFFIEMKCA